MALTPKQKAGVAIGVGALLLLGFAGAANADDLIPAEPKDPDLPPPPPDEIPDVEVPPEDLPPLGPLPFKCNYSGCGNKFDGSHAAPVYYATRIQQLGYPINTIAVGNNGSMIAVAPQRDYIAMFQRHYNAVRAANPIFNASPLAFAPIVAGPKLSTDGLVGENTIAAIQRAHTAILNAGTTWGAVVQISQGA